MNDSFCVLPFYSTEYQYNGTTPCCLVPVGTDVTLLQSEMLAGQRPKICQQCWTLEDQGITSDRQIKNQTFDFYSNRAIELIKQDCSEGKFSEQIVKINSSTLCNSTCFTCKDLNASSSWATLLGKKKEIVINPCDQSKINWADLKMLSLLGGEPLYDSANFDRLEHLIAVGNTDCFISIVTNGSVELTDQQLSILKQFKNLNFCLSIDGVGPVFEYLRYPLKWPRLLSNIELYRSLGIQLSASYTISNLNIAYYDETVSWFESQGLEYNHNVINYPRHYSPNALPKHIKESLKSVAHLFTDHTASDDADYLKLLEDIDLQDKLKNISIQDYLPKLVDLFKSS